MPEPIPHHAHPERRVEHALRYRLAAPLLRGSAIWADLGCGSGADAADVIGGEVPAHALMVDVDEQRAERAAREIGGGAAAMQADLTQAADVERVRARVVAADGPRVVTCFEAIPHLQTFVPLVDMLVGLEDATVLLSVPNDAFWSIDNPHHKTTWGEGSFEELRRMLPEGTVVARQLALRGSGIVLSDPARETAEVELDARDRVPTHFIAAFGPRASEIDAQAAVALVDLDEQRRIDRRRDADIAFLTDQVALLQARLDGAEDRTGLPSGA